MGRVLVIYASHYGQTRKVAEHIAQRLSAQGHEVDLVDARYAERGQPTPEDYDIVVLGSRVEAGRHANQIRTFIDDHIDCLRRMPTVFFSVSMAAARPASGPNPSGHMDSMFAELAWRPTQAVAIAGGLPYRKYGWLMRFMMKRISRAGGHTTDTSRNHEFTDWNRVDELADQIARLLSREPRSRLM